MNGGGVNFQTPQNQPKNDFQGIKQGGKKEINEKYKTQKCRHYEAHGNCALGDFCHFAHGNEELRKPNDPMNPEQEKLAHKSQQYMNCNQ